MFIPFRSSDFPAVVRSVLLGTLLFLAGSLQAPNSLGYTLNGAYWSGSWPVVPYYINAASFPSSVGTQAEVIAAIQKGANHWTFEAGAPITLQYMGTTSVTTRAADGVNVVYYDANNCSSGAGSCVAQTSWWPATGALTDFDITFHGKNTAGSNVNWDAVDPIVFTTDLWGGAAHEFGHAIGLGHSAVTVATMNSTIGASATWYRFLESDDQQGTQALYGTNTEISVSNSQPTAGDTVTISVNYGDSAGLIYYFFSTLNGTSPGLELSSLDPLDHRLFQMNPDYVPMDSYPSIFNNTLGYANGSGVGTMSYYTGGLSGLCLHFAGVILESGWPTGARHVSAPLQICVQ